jgi:hypothetical protein
MASLLDDPAWLRVLPPLIELEADDVRHLLAELDAIPAFRSVREAFAFG